MMIRFIAPRGVLNSAAKWNVVPRNILRAPTKATFGVGALIAFISPLSRSVYCAAAEPVEPAPQLSRTAGELSIGSNSAAKNGNIKKGVDDADDEKLFFDAILSAFGPTTAKFGFGGILGYCSGYAMKQASKVAMVLVGASVVTLQVLQYCGYVEVKWDKIKGDVVGRIDSDRSGRLGFKDFKYYASKMMSILKQNGPTAGGFSTGVYLGFYRG